MKPAAIAAQLVDIRNVGTHKVVKLTVHVPEELALKLTEAFGWPTMVNPVPVALARMEVMPTERSKQADTSPRPSTPQAGGAKSYAQEAGRLCKDVRFQQFLGDTYGYIVPDSDAAARVIYELCDVDTRRDLIEGTPAAQNYKKIVTAYELEKVA